MASVVLEDVTKVYRGHVTAVERLNLTLNDHEFVVLVGPSGCGKTTMLRAIAGLEEISSGQIRIGDRVVNCVSPRKRNVAMVFQDYALYPHMSVFQNLAFGLHLRYGGGWLTRFVRRLVRPANAAKLAELRKGVKQQVQHAAEMLDIEHLLKRMPRHLSGGERQRVALGRAIVREPAAFLFDEPLSHLDANLRTAMRREIKKLHDKLNTTTLYVTHDQAEAMTLGQRIVVMEKGRIQQAGSPSEIYDRPRNRFVAQFIGTPPMNLVTGTLQQREHGWRFVGQGLAVSINKSKETERVGEFSNRSISLGVRPEDIRVELEAEQTNQQTNCGRVTAVESLGDAAHIYVELRTGGDSETVVVSKVTGCTKVRSGDLVNLHIDSKRVHLFDPRTGNNILCA